MLNWDSLIPSSIPAKGTQDVPHAGQEMQENVPDLHKKAAFVPVCPSEKPPVSHLAGQPEPAPLLASMGVSHFVPVVPPVLQGVSCSRARGVQSAEFESFAKIGASE